MPPCQSRWSCVTLSTVAAGLEAVRAALHAGAAALRAGSWTAPAPRPRAGRPAARSAVSSSVGPMLPAIATRLPARCHQQGRHRRGGGLAVGAGDGQHLGRVALGGLQIGQRARKEVQFAQHGDAGGARFGSSGAMRASCGCQAGALEHQLARRPGAAASSGAPPQRGASAAAVRPRSAMAPGRRGSRLSHTVTARRGARTSAPSPGRCRPGPG
jgi:hypothetical protein